MSNFGGNPVATFYITGNASGVTNAVTQANNSLAQLEQAVAQNWWGVKNLGLAFAALPSLVGAGTAAAIVSATKWEDAMAGVARTNFDASKSLEENRVATRALGDELLALARNIPTSALSLAGIAENAGALGVAAQDVAKFTETVANLSAVTDLTETQASADLARIAGLTGTAAAGYDNLASSIATTGVQTAATEKDITLMSTKIAGMAKVVGLSADQVIALAAATRSAGVSATEGGTQIQKSFLDINEAVRGNTEDLKIWAAFAGQSTEDFRKAFAENAGEAFTSVIEGMGKLNASGANVVGMLKDAGVTEQRQVRTLLLLTQAQNQNVNSNLKLSEIMKIANKGFNDTAQYTASLEERYGTLSNQLKILQNVLFGAAEGFGQIFLPMIKLAVVVVGNFVAGLEAAPGPVKALLAVVVGLTTVLSGLAAVALLVGPRILIALGAVNQLQSGFLKAAASAAGFTEQTNIATAAQLRLAGVSELVIRALNAQQKAALGAALASGSMANVSNVLAGANLTVRDAGLGMAGSMATGVTWAGRLAKAGGFLLTTLFLLAVAMSFLGSKQKDASKSAEELVKPQAKLVDALREQTKGAKGAADQWITNQKRYQQAARVADDLRISHEALLNAIKGTGTAQEFDQTIKTLSDSQKKGNDEAKRAIQNLNILSQQYRNSAGEAGVLGSAQESLGVNLGEATKSIEAQTKAAKENQKVLASEAQAHIDYVQAIFSQKEAEFGLADAEEKLRKAREASEERNDNLLRLERSLASARLDSKKAAQDVVDAERALAAARGIAEEKVIDAEDALRDAQDRRSDSLDKQADLEKKISDLRKGPELKDLLKATNDLRHAQLDLAKSSQAVQDAEWNLKRIREDGGSTRDIADAEMALAEAKNAVADAQDKQAQSQQALSDLNDPAKRAEALAKAERDLQDARRNEAKAVRDIAKEERDLADARKDLADDRGVHDAEDDLARARQAVSDAVDREKQAEKELKDERDNPKEIRDLALAQNDYEKALYNVATANAEIKKQTALMKGETYDAGNAAHDLAEELGKVLQGVPDGAQTGRLREFMRTLAEAPDVPEIPDDFGENLSGQMQDQLDENPLSLPPLNPKFPSGTGEKVKSGIQDFIGLALGTIGAFIVRTLVTSLITAAAGGAEGGALGSFAGPIGTIVGFIVGLLITMFLSSETGRKMIEGLWEGISGTAGWIAEKVKGWVKDFINAWKILFGIHSPSDVFSEIGLNLILGLIQGMENKVEDLLGSAREIGGKVVGVFTGAPSWLLDHGGKLIGGLITGMSNRKDEAAQKAGDVASGVMGKFSGLGDSLKTFGSKMLHNLWDGIDSAKDWLFGKVESLGGGILGSISRGIGTLLGKSPSPFGIKVGKDLGTGIEKGVNDVLPTVAKAAISLNTTMAKSIDADLNKLANFGIEGLLGVDRQQMALAGGSSAPVAAAAGAPTIINNDIFNLEAITNADPDDIVNEYVFKKRIRVKGS